MSSALADPPASGFYGLGPIQRRLSENWFRAGSPLRLSSFLGSPALGDLLGIYVSSGSTGGYKNDSPNATNAVLWKVLFSGLTQELTTVCTTPAGAALELDPGFSRIITELCAWPAPSAKRIEILEQLWVRTLGYSAPYDEFIAWTEFFLDPGLDLVDGPNAVRQLTLSLVLHPYLLLRN